MWLVALFSLIAAFAQTVEPTTGWLPRTLDHDGMRRTYAVYVPESMLDTPPLVIVLHPAGGSSRTMAFLTRFPEFSELSGWLTVYPDGPGGYWDYGAGTPQWKDVPDLRDDPGFIAAMIETVSAEYNVDPTRIYAVGYSNGARMAHRMACELPLAGAAMVAATISDEVTAICSDRKVAVWMQHGTSDAVVPFIGDPDLTLGNLRLSRALSVIETAQFFALRNGCDNPTITRVYETADIIQLTMDIVRYQDCEGGASVEVLVATGGGHGWQHVSDVDTSAVIWGFFERHTLVPLDDETPEPTEAADSE